MTYSKQTKAAYRYLVNPRMMHVLARDYGMVFQQPGLMEWRTIQKNVELPLQVAGMKHAERAERARELLKLVRLDGFESHRPGQLSGGMQQRARNCSRAIVRTKNFAHG